MDEFSQWHSIRPWRPSLSLSVREITSVSATFILSSPLIGPDSTAVKQSLASLGISNDDDDDDADGEGSGSGGRGVQIVSDVLSKGLSVKVNGTPWQRVLMKIDDEADQAVIILFGLMPGRQYDVELGVVPNENTLRSQITTDTTHRGPEVDANAESLVTEIAAEQSDQALSIASSQADAANGNLLTDPPAPSFSLEDRRLQLNHTLQLLTAEHTTLISTLKAARRDSQKADAALRAEIDSLKRASERAAPGELRARQKAKALQEAARQALAAAEQVQARVQELEESLPELVQRRDEVEHEWQRVHGEADKVRRRREEAESKERKRVEAKQAELAGLAGRLERLSTRREKLEGPGGVLGDLEEKLRRLEEERERIESDPYGYVVEEGDGEYDTSRDDSASATFTTPHAAGGTRTLSHGQHSHPRKRHSHPSNQPRAAPPPIARPDPIQRPGFGARTNPPPGPGVLHLHGASHAHSNSLPSARRTPPSNNGATGGGSTSGSSSSSPAPAGPSNLSGRAPPFEPRSGVKSDLNPGSSPFEPRVGSLSLAAQTQLDNRMKSPGAGAAPRT